MSISMVLLFWWTLFGTFNLRNQNLPPPTPQLDSGSMKDMICEKLLENFTSWQLEWDLWLLSNYEKNGDVKSSNTVWAAG